jgi:predicted metallopeptidase
MNWHHAPDINRRVNFLINQLHLLYVHQSRVFCFRSIGSSGRATARIWSLPQIWQQALNTPPGYCLEVISEKFDRLSLEQQEKVLIHELLHIPSTFSGSLSPHRTHHRRTFRHYHDQVETLFNKLSVASRNSFPLLRRQMRAAGSK